MSYNSCPFSGNPWRAYSQHCDKIDEIFDKYKNLYEEDTKRLKPLEKESKKLLNKSSQEK